MGRCVRFGIFPGHLWEGVHYQSPAETPAACSVRVSLSHEEAAPVWTCPAWRAYLRVPSLRSELWGVLHNHHHPRSTARIPPNYKSTEHEHPVPTQQPSHPLLLLPSVLAMSHPARSMWSTTFPGAAGGRGGAQPSDEGWYLRRSQPGPTPLGFTVPLARSTSMAQLR